jgi:hypothetical protein
MNASSMAANALAEDAAERRRGPVVGGVVPSKVRCARHRDEAQPPAPQVLLGLLIHTALLLISWLLDCRLLCSSVAIMV